MAANNLTKKLIAAGITANTDGLLRDLISRGIYKSAIDTVDVAIARRFEQIEFLKGLKVDLKGQAMDDQGV